MIAYEEHADLKYYYCKATDEMMTTESDEQEQLTLILIKNIIGIEGE